jgi:hypothetical protein
MDFMIEKASMPAHRTFRFMEKRRAGIDGADREHGMDIVDAYLGRMF